MQCEAVSILNQTERIFYVSTTHENMPGICFKIQYKLNLLFKFGEDGCICVCVGKMAKVMFVTWCGFADGSKILLNVLLWTKWFVNKLSWTMVLTVTQDGGGIEW